MTALTEDNILELVSKVSEFEQVSDMMDDPEVDQALAIVVKLLAKPDIPQAKVALLIVQLQAISTKMGINSKLYMTTKSDPKKKGMYFTLAERLDRLVDSLKYLAK